jgi:hypothetical protein
MRIPRYNLLNVQESYSRIANSATRARAPEAGGAPAKVTAEEVRALFSAARGPDGRMGVDEKVRLATEWNSLKQNAGPEAQAEFKRLSSRLNLPEAGRLDGIRDALRLKWGPQVDSPAPKVTAKQLQEAIAAGKDSKGKLDDASKFLIAYEWNSIPDRAKTPEVKREYERLRTQYGLPTFVDGKQVGGRDLGVG